MRDLSSLCVPKGSLVDENWEENPCIFAVAPSTRLYVYWTLILVIVVQYCCYEENVEAIYCSTRSYRTLFLCNVNLFMGHHVGNYNTDSLHQRQCMNELHSYFFFFLFFMQQNFYLQVFTFKILVTGIVIYCSKLSKEYQKLRPWSQLIALCLELCLATKLN